MNTSKYSEFYVGLADHVVRDLNRASTRAKRLRGLHAGEVVLRVCEHPERFLAWLQSRREPEAFSLVAERTVKVRFPLDEFKLVRDRASRLAITVGRLAGLALEFAFVAAGRQRAAA